MRTDWKSLYIVMFFASVPFLFYFTFNPIYNGTPWTKLSADRSAIQGDNVRSWGDTFVCTPKEIHRPTTVNDVKNIVLRSEQIRVVGGGHSFSPLVCTKKTLVSLEKMNKVLEITENSITVEAGATIEQVITHLLNVSNKIIHGFGSIQYQSVAGAFSTSHHGLTFHSFSEDVIALTAVLANGTVIETSDLFYWRSHLGMLGVITSMKIKTYENTVVNIETKKLSLDDAVSRLPFAHAGIIETNYAHREEGILKFITIEEPVKESLTYPINYESFLAAMWDTVLIPLAVLIPSVTEFNTQILTQNKTHRAPMVTAWSKFPEYGMLYSAYAIPYANCTKFVRAIQTDNHRVSTLLIRYVREQANSICMTFAAKNSCVVDLYDLQSQSSIHDFHVDVETLVSDFGGTSHWGKYYAGDVSKQISNVPCYNDFKTKRDLYDPGNKFLNDYTKEIMGLNPESEKRYPGKSNEKYVVKSTIMRILTILSILSIISITFYRFFLSRPEYVRIKTSN